MEITLEEIEKKFENLPEDLKWAIMAAQIDEHVLAIGQRHGLNVEQIGQLSLETHMVVLGYTHPEDFENSLKQSLSFPDEKNKEIVQEINEQILGEIREKLKSLGENTEENNLQEKEISNENYFSEDNEQNTKAEDLIKETENKKIMETVAFKKLSGSFNSPTTKTEYTLNNLSKEKDKTETTNIQNAKIINGSLPQKDEPVNQTSSYKEDPYRVKPE